MRTSVVIAGADAPANAFVVWRGYRDSIAKAQRFGYDGVELALGVAADVDERELDGALKEHGVKISCISTGLTYAQRGLYLTAADKDIRTAAIDAIAGLIRLAEEHGGLVTLGRARGYVAQGQTRSEAKQLLADGLQTLQKEAASRGVWLAIEPINRYESNFLNAVDEAGNYVRSLGLTNIGIMADLFHMNIEDGNICAALERNRDLLRHVHVADSNRLAPGMGHTDIRGALKTLKRIGYGGWLSAEILPGDCPDEMARAASKAMRALIEEVYNEQER